VWSRGRTAVLSVSLLVETYNVSAPSVNGSPAAAGNDRPWLVGAPSAVHCSGVWHSVARGNMHLADVSQFSVDDDRLGPYDAVARKYVLAPSAKHRDDTVKLVPVPAPTTSHRGAVEAIAPAPATTADGRSLTFVETFIWFQQSDTFAFNQTFPEGCPNMSLSEPPSSSSTFHGSAGVNASGLVGEFNGAMLPSTRFPGFYLYGTLASLGFVTWQGRFMHDESTHGIGLQGFEGGSAGGPLVLFNTGVKRSSAMVLSSMDQFMSGIGAVVNVDPGRTDGGGDVDTGQCSLEAGVDFEGCE